MYTVCYSVYPFYKRRTSEKMSGEKTRAVLELPNSLIHLFTVTDGAENLKKSKTRVQRRVPANTKLKVKVFVHVSSPLDIAQIVTHSVYDTRPLSKLPMNSYLQLYRGLFGYKSTLIDYNSSV